MGQKGSLNVWSERNNITGGAERVTECLDRPKIIEPVGQKGSLNVWSERNNITSGAERVTECLDKPNIIEPVGQKGSLNVWSERNNITSGAERVTECLVCFWICSTKSHYLYQTPPPTQCDLIEPFQLKHMYNSHKAT